MEYGDWHSPDYGELIAVEPSDQSTWDALASRFTGTNDKPLKRCLEVARDNDVHTVIREPRYIDLDYRSEYATYYSRTFQSIPDSATRLHFFRDRINEIDFGEFPASLDYVGYVVIRPSVAGQVGRTLLAPPPDVKSAVRTAITERVNVFGRPYTVTGVPFMQQDTLLGRCAHAAAWMCHYTAANRGLVARRAIAEFSLGADPLLGFGRPIPSSGLTMRQVIELLRLFGLPSLYYNIDNLPSSTTPPLGQTIQAGKKKKGVHAGFWDFRIRSLVCRYLNSQFPVLVGVTGHAFVLCGYERFRESGQESIRFIRHDDQYGPYITVPNIFDDHNDDGRSYSPWQALVVPLPDKVWLNGEDAELTGFEMLLGAAHSASSNKVTDFADLLRAERVSLRTFVMRSNDFKASLDARGIDPEVARMYRRARLPRYVWVVEASNRERRGGGVVDHVVGEAILDATAAGARTAALAAHVPGYVSVKKQPDTGQEVSFVGTSPYASGQPAASVPATLDSE